MFSTIFTPHSNLIANLISFIRWLLSNGLKDCIEQQNSDGKTPLHEAAQNVHLECTEILISEGK